MNATRKAKPHEYGGISMKWFIPPVFVILSLILMGAHAWFASVPGLFSFPYNYVGVPLALLLGAAIACNTAYSLLFPLAFFFAAQFWYIPFEEKRMKQTFGEAYDAYCQRTRRWI